jgi:cytoskeleton protein RodZ
MGIKQVQALEAGNYEALPTGTFLRGFVRNYAHAVGLDADETLALLERTHPEARAIGATRVVEPARQKMSVREPAGWLASPQMQGVAIAVVILALAAAFAYWWTYMRGAVPRVVSAAAGPSGASGSPPATAAVQPPVDAARAEPSGAPVVLPVAPGSVARNDAGLVAAGSAPMTANVKPGADPTTEAVKKPRVANATVLGFTFSGESWVEVVDAGGRILLSRRFKAGDADEVGGKPPLSVTIGNAAVTRMAVNGQEFDLAPHTRGAVARVSAR